MQQLERNGKTLNVYIPENQIQAKVRELAEQISLDYEGKNPLILGVLNGAFMFLADLMRYMTIDVEVDFMKMSSYEGTESTNNVRCLLGIKQDLTDRHVIIVDDILETGQTLQKIIRTVQSLGAASIKTCVLVDKVNKLKVDLKPDYPGFKVDDLFVIGYGMDWDEWGRHLKQIYVAI